MIDHYAGVQIYGEDEYIFGVDLAAKEFSLWERFASWWFGFWYPDEFRNETRWFDAELSRLLTPREYVSSGYEGVIGTLGP